MTTATPEQTEQAEPIVALELDNSPEEQRRRRRVAIALVVAAVLAVVLALTTHSGTAKFQFVNGQLTKDVLGLPARPLSWIGAVLAVVGAGAYVGGRGGRGSSGLRRWSSALVAVAFLVTFLSWAAAGQLFPLANQLQGTISFATPLVLGALAGVMCERAGVINIAIEGQLLMGAMAAAVVGSLVAGHGWGIWVAMLAAMLAGLLIAALLAVFAIKFGVNQVVLGVVLVVFATGLTGYIFDQFLQSDAAANSPDVMNPVAIPLLGKIPIVGPILFTQTWLVYLTVVAVVLVPLVLFKTRWGLRVRSVGEHPLAADTVGVNVRRIRYQAVLIGGLLAGLGGSFFTVGSTGSFSKDMTSGNGFIALAALIMGRWHPVGATLAALFFGFTTQLQSQLQIVHTPIPNELWPMVPYLATIIAVAGLVGKVRAPKADGEPYEGHK